MAGVGQSASVTEDQTGGDAPSALRIDTGVLATLTETVGDDRNSRPPIVGWFDCWRP